MKSNKPYLLRAFYEWIVDSQCTPYVLINAEKPNVEVPAEFIEEGRIVLNVSPHAVMDLGMTNQALYFRASFSGLEKRIYAPIVSVLGIYAQENGRGIVFEDEDEEEEESSSDSDDTSSASGSKKPHLHVVE